MRPFIPLLLLLLASQTALPQAPKVVALNVQFTDDIGNPLTSIEAGQIRVFEGTEELQVVRVIGPDKPFDVGMLLDVSPSGHRNVDVIRTETSRFFRSLPIDAEGMILTFDNQVYVDCDWTTDRKELDECIFEFGLHKPGDNSIIFEAVVLALEQKYVERGARQLMILFTDGVENGSDDIDEDDSFRAARTAPATTFVLKFDSREHYRRLHGGVGYDPSRPPPVAAGDPNPTIGGISVGGRQSERQRIESQVQSQYNRAVRYLRALAEAGRGPYFELLSDDDLTRAYDQVLSQIDRVYTIEFKPSQRDRGNRLHEVRITIDRDEVFVKPWSKGYYLK